MVKKKSKKVLEIPSYIKITAKIISTISPVWAAKFALNLFDRPLKFPIPKREKQMSEKAVQFSKELPLCNKSIHVYQYGNGNKKALLIHGWNGRGTQMSVLAKELVDNEYTVYSFDAPGHGKSPNSRAIMTDFIEGALELDKSFGPFDLVVGHSLGGMSTVNALSRGLHANKAVLIGAGDIIQDIIDDFVLQLGLKKEIGKTVTRLFEKKYSKQTDVYDVYLNASKLNLPILVIHDIDDKDVPYTCAKHIAKHLPNGELMTTEKLGHRKILGDENVIKKIINFSTT